MADKKRAKSRGTKELQHQIADVIAQVLAVSGPAELTTNEITAVSRHAAAEVIDILELR